MLSVKQGIYSINTCSFLSLVKTHSSALWANLVPSLELTKVYNLFPNLQICEASSVRNLFPAPIVVILLTLESLKLRNDKEHSWIFDSFFKHSIA